MRSAVMIAGLLAWAQTMPLAAQEAAPVAAAAADPITIPLDGTPEAGLVPPAGEPIADGTSAVEPPWHTAWGLAGLRAIPAGPKAGPNGLRYHPNFSLDLNLNGWLWPSHGLYLFSDLRLWGQRGQDGVTNRRDGWLATSKRQFDLSGGAAWNYVGNWEARAFGYTQNNLNRGISDVKPSGFTDGFGLENRYYLSPEYARLGQAGFDVARATFLSFGYYPSKSMMGNDGRPFHPGMLLRGYVTYDLWDWRCYAFGDVSYISECSFAPRLLFFDLGLAGRPFGRCRQCEFRLGAESTGDFQAGDVFSLWYFSVRYIF